MDTVCSLPDVQNGRSTICIALNRVGITGLKLPIFISQKCGGNQHSVAMIDCFVDLDKDQKGINMSRLPIGLQKFKDQTLNQKLVEDIAENIRVTSEARVCELIYHFPYFINKLSPVNKEPGLVHYDIIFRGIKRENSFDFAFTIGITATSLCPCSKELSTSNAHNQRSLIQVTCTPKPGTWIWLEDIIELCEQSASCEIYSVLKRPDEKHVTDRMYDNAKFVEDITRECFQSLSSIEDLERFIVEVTNYESIHQHNAYSKLES